MQLVSMIGSLSRRKFIVLVSMLCTVFAGPMLQRLFCESWCRISANHGSNSTIFTGHLTMRTAWTGWN